MKFYFYLIQLLFPVVIYAQTPSCQDKTNVPYEYISRIHTYQEPGEVDGHPFTMFNKNKEGWDLNFALNQIRQRILNSPLKLDNTDTNIYYIPVDEYASIYKAIYNKIKSNPAPSTCNYNSDCSHPVWVKENAFLALIGIRWRKIYGMKDTFEMIDNQSEIDYFANNAKNGLSDLNPEIISCYGGEDCGKVHLKAFDLMQYLQAYDLLKTGGFIQNDANVNDCSPRNKLREFSRNLYDESNNVINSHTGWKRNHGIICASVLGMSSIVLNGAGAKRWRYRYRPYNWHRRADGTPGGRSLLGIGEDGLEDLFFIGNRREHFFGVENCPQSSPDGKSGYAEGPGYFTYSMRAFLPYMRTKANFLPNDNSYLKLEKYQNILFWYQNILNQDGYAPSYDNTVLKPINILGILGDPKFSSAIPPLFGELGENIDLTIDYILAKGSDTQISKGEYLNEQSGNIVLRTETENANYSFHMLAEKDFAIDKPDRDADNTHEDQDLGSFMIYAGDKGNDLFALAIDPPYDKWANVSHTNKLWMHNIISVGGSPSVYGFSNPKFSNIKTWGTNSKEIDLKLDFGVSAFDTLPELFIPEMVTRNLSVFFQNSRVYYLMNDFFDSELLESYQFSTAGIKFNGNGNLNDSIPTFIQIGNLNKWFYPCIANSNNGWQIISHHAALGGGLQQVKPWISLTEGTGYGIKKSNKFTRLDFVQLNKPKTIFQSVYFPQKCVEELPKVYKLDSFENKLVTIVEFKNQVDTLEIFSNGKNKMGYITDTVSHFHLSKWTGAEADSVVNPFQRNNEANKKLYFNAQKLFVEKHSLAFLDKRVGFCPPTYAHFRNYFANDISYLIFGNDTLFYSDKLIDADFALTGRHSYHFKITPKVSTSSSDSIKIKLPDVARGTDMVAIIDITADTLKGRYDSLCNFMYLVLPQQATGFSIIQKDLCSDCYFPPVGTNFDTLFVANDGLKHILGNSKKITSNHGQVKITNSTQIEMCPGVILHNTDSILVEGPPQSEPMNIPSCGGVDNLKKYSKNSMLIVSPYSALVLDANSKTYIKNGAGLYIKQNGSLVVKNGALLEIGDSGTAGYGEFYAEAGAFVYIEPGAIIRYRRTIGDTIDRNYMIFGMNSGGVVAGLPYQIDSVLKADSIIPSYNTALAICDLDSLNPIGNKQWGYTNFGKPEAKFFTRSLNLCEGEPFHISLKRMLNDATLKIKVCKMDSILVPDGYGSHVWKYRCLQDSLVLDSVPPDPTCLIPRISPDEWTWYFPANTLHRVQITVTNECGKMHDTTVLVRVLDSAQISLSAPTIACEGIGTVKVIPSLNQSGNVKYVFEVNEVLDSSNLNVLLNNPAEEYSFQTTGILPDTFSFPGMYFKGGRKYLIAFSYISNCGVVTAEKEVNIPTGAYIELERPTVYANPINGATSVQMRGHTTLADSFVWSPTTYLNRSDTLVVVSSPEDQIYYTLTAYHNNCMATDTAWIKYNRIANAGEADTICFNFDGVRLGNAYDYSLFLGFLNYKGGNNFKDIIYEYTQNDSNFFRNFSVFMKQDEFISTIENCAPTFYSNFKTLFWRDSLINQTWFKDYWMSLLVFNDPKYFQLDTFTNRILESASLTDHINSLDDWSSISSCVFDIFKVYFNIQSSNAINVSSTWTKLVANDSMVMDEWNNRVLTYDYPTKNTIYINNVITPSYAEIDEVNILVDTAIQVYFSPVFQSDSSVFFESMLTPNQGNPIYAWNFGDGTAISHEANPFHTFTAFDSSYKVCLTVFNLCGTYTFCDTVYIDSLHWGGSIEKVNTIKSKNETIKPHLMNLEVMVYPNPTKSNALLVYNSEEEHFEGKLVITDIGGRSIWESDLKQKSGNIKIPSQHWNDGLYFFHLQTSSGTKTGKLIVRH